MFDLNRLRSKTTPRPKRKNFVHGRRATISFLSRRRCETALSNSEAVDVRRRQNDGPWRPRCLRFHDLTRGQDLHSGRLRLSPRQESERQFRDRKAEAGHILLSREVRVSGSRTAVPRPASQNSDPALPFGDNSNCGNARRLSSETSRALALRRRSVYCASPRRQY